MNKYEEIIKVNSGLIYMIMNKYFKGYDKDDLYQVGVIGVIKAYNNYKNDHNFLHMLLNIFMERCIII